MEDFLFLGIWYLRDGDAVVSSQPGGWNLPLSLSRYGFMILFHKSENTVPLPQLSNLKGSLATKAPKD